MDVQRYIDFHKEMRAETERKVDEFALHAESLRRIQSVIESAKAEAMPIVAKMVEIDREIVPMAAIVRSMEKLPVSSLVLIDGEADLSVDVPELFYQLRGLNLNEDDIPF